MNKNNFLYLVTLIFLIFVSGCSLKNSDKKTVISFSGWGSQSEISTLEPLLKEFESKNPDIKVKFIHIPKNYFQKLHLLVASNLIPDVAFINNINGKVYIQNFIFEDLDPYIKKDNDITRKDFFNKSLEAFEYNNALYAIPRDVSNIVVYYNKDIFDRYNVPYPDKNWSFDDFLKTAKSLTKDLNNDGKTDIFGVSFEENPLFWLPFLWSNGGGLISEDLKEVTITRPQSKEALIFYSNLRNKWNVAPRAEEQGSSTMAQMFIQGKIAMHISGRWSTPVYRKNPNLNWDITAFPSGTKGSVVDADASGWAMSKTSKNKQEAWRLIKFLASKTAAEKFTKDGLIVPARKDVAFSEVFLNKSEKPQHARIFVDVITNAIPTPANDNYQEIIDIVNQDFEPFFRGKTQLDNVLNKNFEQKILKLLSK